MNRITTVIKTAVIGFLGANLILIFILFLDYLIEGTKIPWESIGFSNLYGITFSIFFGIMDRPKLETKILKAITISALVVLISSFFTDINKILVTQTCYVLIGIPITKSFVRLIDLFLEKSN